MDSGTNMFCLNKKGYLPIPPNAWYRVQNRCSLETSSDDNGGLVTIPYSGEVVPYVELGKRIAMLNKGNILQYKNNSSNLTKQQRYSQIAKGQWTNRTKTWATQSTRGYTNPNTSGYIREGGTNVTLNGTPTTAPVTCPALDFLINNILPLRIAGGSGATKVPPPIPPKKPNSGENVIPLVPVGTPADTVIQDFGNLVCGTYENFCTGEFLAPFKIENCHPTSDSDVPGPIESLCWNDGTPTWYPRQRYVMNNSTDKWPVNAPLGNAIQFKAPTLSATLSSCDIITLSWQIDNFYTSFNIYQNGNYLDKVDGSTSSYLVKVNNIGTYSFYIKGYNGNTESDASNTVSVSVVAPPPAPTNLTISTTCNIATLSWTNTSTFNLTYQIYENGALIGTTTLNTYNVTLASNVPYTFYVVSLADSCQSSPSNTVSATFVEFTTNGSITNYNPLSGNTTVTGYTYILFNTAGSFYFNSTCNISNFYYMIVGPGGKAQSGFVDNSFSIGGVGGGAGGIWNGLTSLSSGNYSITIPAINNANSTVIQNASSSTLFNITSTAGGFPNRGVVTKTVNSITTILSGGSSTNTPTADFGVGGRPSEVTNITGSYQLTLGTAGGTVYLGTNPSGNYINFLGDNRLSNTLFGGGGGGGGTGGASTYSATDGYNGGGGGGGGGQGKIGGTGLNGSNGSNGGGSTGGAGGNAFTNISATPGYGGGGGGGGSIYGGGTYSAEGAGGNGGSAMLMIYFIKQI